MATSSLDFVVASIRSRFAASSAKFISHEQFSGTSRVSGRIGMTGADLLVDAFERIPEQVHGVLDGLTPDQLTFRIDSEANTIAWLIWHLSRIEDDHIADVAGRPQVWTSDGWATRWRLPFDAADTGYGHPPEQVAAVNGNAELLLGYSDAVHQMTANFVR